MSYTCFFSNENPLEQIFFLPSSHEKKTAQTGKIRIPFRVGIQRPGGLLQHNKAEEDQAGPQESPRQRRQLFQPQKREGWIQGGLLLHQLVPVQGQDRQVHPRGHPPRSVHARHLRLRLAEEGQALLIREQRRNQGRQGGLVREDTKVKKGQSPSKDSLGYR